MECFTLTAAPETTTRPVPRCLHMFVPPEGMRIRGYNARRVSLTSEGSSDDQGTPGPERLLLTPPALLAADAGKPSLMPKSPKGGRGQSPRSLTVLDEQHDDANLLDSRVPPMRLSISRAPVLPSSPASGCGGGAFIGGDKPMLLPKSPKHRIAADPVSPSASSLSASTAASVASPAAREAPEALAGSVKSVGDDEDAELAPVKPMLLGKTPRQRLQESSPKAVKGKNVKK